MIDASERVESFVADVALGVVVRHGECARVVVNPIRAVTDPGLADGVMFPVAFSATLASNYSISSSLVNPGFISSTHNSKQNLNMHNNNRISVGVEANLKAETSTNSCGRKAPNFFSQGNDFNSMYSDSYNEYV